MNVSDFPAALQPLIHQGFIEREFSQALRSQMRYRDCADRINVAAGIGETVTETRAGLSPGSTEQYTLTIGVYAATIDLHLITQRFGIASQFLQNAYVNGEQAARSLDQLARMTLSAAYSGNPLRPRGCKDTADLGAPDTLTMPLLLEAVAKLSGHAVPEIDGAYNCYLDPVSARQLFADPDFKALFNGAPSANQVFRSGVTNNFLGIRFVPVIEGTVRMHPTKPNVTIRSPIICGQGALVECGLAGLDAADVAPKDSIVTIIDGVAMVTYEAVDRLQQIIAQSWYWIGSFAAPADITTDQSATHKRAVIIEHVG